MIRRGDSRELAWQAVRFIVVGGANTVLTYGLFLLLAVWVDERVSYTVAFAVGLVFTTFLSSRWVFAGRRSARALAQFVGWYLLVWLVGLSLVAAFGHGGLGRHLLAVGVVLCVTTPLNFFGGRFILNRPDPAMESETVPL